YNDAGAWPGMVARLKSGVSIEDAKTAMSALEGADLSALYLLSPGVFDPFKDGSINSYPTRYARGSATGASLNYGFAGNYFFVSTSYDGLKTAAGLLGI
ncbi:MAG: hypothetical protein AAB923_01660, partial [Patescibacteria group bacterium]